MIILSISALYHGSAARLATDGRIISAAQKEQSMHCTGLLPKKYLVLKRTL